MDSWVLKYRPRRYEDVLGQDNVIKMIRNNINKLPHMIFYGPPGVSKSTVIELIANEIYGKNKKKNTLFLNASDERGIDTVRNKMKYFAQQKIDGNKDSNISFKLIVLDEADSMTAEAQTALRRIMEKYSGITRFCFICNYVNKIIKPISSRCAIFRFKKIDKSVVENRLKQICEMEKCDDLKEIVPLISINVNGDLRQGIIMLESLKKSKGNIRNICERVPDDLIRINFKSFDDMLDGVNNIFYNGFNILYVMLKIREKIVESDFSNKKKADLLINLNKCQMKINQGCDEKIQFYNFFKEMIE